jgi:hypothetical protein
MRPSQEHQFTRLIGLAVFLTICWVAILRDRLKSRSRETGFRNAPGIKSAPGQGSVYWFALPILLPEEEEKVRRRR